MYIMIAFMGKALAGANASSHAFFILSMSISSAVGGFRDCDFDTAERCYGNMR